MRNYAPTQVDQFRAERRALGGNDGAANPFYHHYYHRRYYFYYSTRSFFFSLRLCSVDFFFFFCMHRSRLLSCLSRALHFLFAPMPSLSIAGQQPQILLVGLGNPGRRYRRTRHNVGEAALEAIVCSPAADFSPLEDSSFAGVWLSVGTLGSVRVAAAVPRSYMNLAGGAVGALARRLGLDADSVLVCHRRSRVHIQS